MQMPAYAKILDANEICEERINKLLRNLNNRTGRLFVAYFNNKVIGFLWFFIIDINCLRKVHINSIAVDSSFRTKGVGTALLNKVEQEAMALDASYLELYVDNNNETAISLYENVGYEKKKIVMGKWIKND